MMDLGQPFSSSGAAQTLSPGAVFPETPRCLLRYLGSPRAVLPPHSGCPASDDPGARAASRIGHNGQGMLTIALSRFFRFGTPSLVILCAVGQVPLVARPPAGLSRLVFIYDDHARRSQEGADHSASQPTAQPRRGGKRATVPVG